MPLSQTGLIIPKILKVALSNSLVDVILSKLYPDVYKVLLNYVESFTTEFDLTILLKYKETNKVCESMIASVDFMKKYKTLNASEGIELVEKALPSLEFHKDLDIVRNFIELCASKLPLYQYDLDLLEKFERKSIQNIESHH